MKKKITLTRAKLGQIKKDVCDEATEKATLLFLAALHDEYGFGEKRLCRVLETISRYAEHIDNHLISLREVQKIVEKNTGLTFKGW